MSSEPVPPTDDAELPEASEPEAPTRERPPELMATSELHSVERHRVGQFRAALSNDAGSTGLGTFRGVFRPTILTILGVMLYLRLGWVVGEVGLFGALLVLTLIFGITVPTALSLSSITTNVRLGAGGVFQLIAQSLGLETGGAIGIPLYVAQALSAGLYLYGFTETWRHVFPEHPTSVVLGCSFFVIAATVSLTEELAIRMQGVVLWIGVAALCSIVLGLPFTEVASVDTLQRPELWGDGSIWQTFAVFFPAGTGIMIGAGMAGTLANPRRSIPRGTLFAVGVAVVVYVLMALWYSVMATPTDLRGDYLIVVERAAWGPVVLVGIFASTFTAALNSMVTAPRVLQSLAAYKILPGMERIAASRRRAALVTSVLVALVLTLGSLNRVAVLITMFFLLTYLIVNVVVLIEQSLGMVSFRPRFRVPLIVPIAGAIGSSMASFIVSPGFAMIAIGVVLGIYVWLSNRDLETPWETVRSSIFVSIVDWASRRVDSARERHNERSWKPDLIVPVTTRAQLDGNFRFLRAMTHPKGSLQVFGVSTEGPREIDHLEELTELADEFREEGLYSTATVLESPDLVHGVRQCCSVLAGSQFRPNVLYALVQQHDEDVLQGLLDAANDHEIGAAFLEQHPEAGFGREKTINVWVRDQSPEWHLGLRLANLDLAILFAYQIGRNWQARIRMITAVADPADREMAQTYLRQLVDDARMPRGTEMVVMEGRFDEAIEDAPHADLNILGMPLRIDKRFLERICSSTGSSVLFVRDSGRESALA